MHHLPLKGCSRAGTMTKHLGSSIRHLHHDLFNMHSREVEPLYKTAILITSPETDLMCRAAWGLLSEATATSSSSGVIENCHGVTQQSLQINQIEALVHNSRGEKLLSRPDLTVSVSFLLSLTRKHSQLVSWALRKPHGSSHVVLQTQHVDSRYWSTVEVTEDLHILAAEWAFCLL